MTDQTTPTQETLPIWQARSFYAQIGALVAALLALTGESELGAEFAEKFPDHMMALIAAGLGLWAYIERLLGKMKLVL